MTQRKMVQIRMSESGVDKLDELAKAYVLTRADVIRACLTIAFRNQDELQKLLYENRSAL